MPFKYDLTWIAHAKRWRKRYRGKTYYLRAKANGRKDREGYLSALEEWQRLKAFIDGFGPSPYSPSGIVIPENQSVFPVLQPVGSNASLNGFRGGNDFDDPPFILSRGIAAGLHPELLVTAPQPVYADERRLSEQVTKFKQHRKREAERGELSLKQYDEDRRQVEAFQNFVNVNFSALVFVDQISPEVLNAYREKQTELCTSPLTLKKRLGGVRKFLLWLIDQNALRELPKDLSSYAKVKQRKPTLLFFTVEEVRSIYLKSSGVLRACVLLGLNCGFTQQDCSTLKPGMIDWQTGILTRDRNKTGVMQKAKLWPETLEALKAVASSGEFLLTINGNALVVESISDDGKVVKTDRLQKAWKATIGDFGGKTFKHPHAG